MNRLSKTESGIFIARVISKGSPFRNLCIFTAAGVNCRVLALKGLSVLYHSADYIFWPLYIHTMSDFLASKGFPFHNLLTLD